MTQTPQISPPSQDAKPGFAARIKQHLLHPEMSPEQVALSFAIGFSICWNPLLGLHTWMVIGTCFAFRRLHRPLMLVAAFLNNPWTMVPIASLSVLVGNVLMGRGWALDLSSIHWHEIGWRSFTSRGGFEGMLAMLRPILAPYLLGGFLLSVLAVPIGYFVVLRLTRRLRTLHLPHFHHAPKASE